MSKLRQKSFFLTKKNNSIIKNQKPKKIKKNKNSAKTYLLRNQITYVQPFVLMRHMLHLG